MSPFTYASKNFENPENTEFETAEFTGYKLIQREDTFFKYYSADSFLLGHNNLVLNTITKFP